MAYQRKRPCYRCDGKGKGVVEMFQSDWDKSHPDWMAQLPCRMCDGKGYYDYDFRPRHYKGKFESVDWESLDISYEDFDARYKCTCGGEIYFSDADMVVCNCGRVYKLSIKLTVDKTHLLDMEYWEKYEDKGK